MDPKCFKKFKKEILRRIAQACVGAAWYRTAYATRSYAELMAFIADNHELFVDERIFDNTLYEAFKEEFIKYNIEL
jgi:hypothetical protein